MYVVAKLKEEQKQKRRRVGTNQRSQINASTAATWEPTGWLTSLIPCEVADHQEPLGVHANWTGPSKAVAVGSGYCRITEVFVSRELFGDQVFDEQAREQCDSLIAKLNQTVFQRGSEVGEQSGWVAPDTEDLERCLTISGFQPTVDEDGNLRMMLKSQLREGQVHLRCDQQRLRFTMQLGSWRDLGDVNEQAMLCLAQQANACGRLARVAWIVDGDKRRCEGQVDLTGVPSQGPMERIWPDMMRLSMQALQLLLRRLPVELDVLANASNANVTTQMLQTRPEVVDAVSAAVS